MVDSGGTGPTIVWFRDDLRLRDNPALDAACKRGAPVMPLFIHDETSPGVRPLGGAAKWWLHHSLTSLSADLAKRGQALIVRKGKAATVLPKLARDVSAHAVVWNRRHDAAAAVDDAVAAALKKSRIEAEVFEASLLYPPEAVRTGSGGSYRVYSAFWRAAQERGQPRRPIPAPSRIPFADMKLGSLDLAMLGLLPSGPDWTTGIRAAWKPGEAGAQAKLAAFLKTGNAYVKGRDLPAEAGTSMLSPYLRFGEISANDVWHAVHTLPADARIKFRGELGWREFNWHLLAEHPDLATNNLNPAYDDFPWGDTYAQDIWDWRRGRTGYPIVDAGMRQLWKTGWMHNRVRMIVASFLAKDLLADWRIGEEWFWDTLVDADAANNPANWQWVAGSGADAQPFFRIFNPVLQGEKFDPKGEYVRRFVPELKDVPDKFIHKPWTAPASVLARAGVTLGQTYPEPIVDHATARQQALEAFDAIRGKK